jgi:hypothetical protein
VTVCRIHVECWIRKATRTRAYEEVHAPGHPHARTHTHVQIFANAPHCYVIRALSLAFDVKLKVTVLDVGLLQWVTFRRSRVRLLSCLETWGTSRCDAEPHAKRTAASSVLVITRQACSRISMFVIYWTVKTAKNVGDHFQY